MSRRKKKPDGRGRPERITPDILRKLEDAFSNALPDVEACLYAGIAPSTLYLYQNKHPGFSERKEALKMHPNIAARKAIVAALNNNDVRVSQWWLEKKDNDFKPTSKIEHSGKIDTGVGVQSAAVAEALKAYELMREKQIQDEARAMP